MFIITCSRPGFLAEVTEHPSFCQEQKMVALFRARLRKFNFGRMIFCSCKIVQSGIYLLEELNSASNFNETLCYTNKAEHLYHQHFPENGHSASVLLEMFVRHSVPDKLRKHSSILLRTDRLHYENILIYIFSSKSCRLNVTKFNSHLHHVKFQHAKVIYNCKNLHLILLLI